MPILSKSDYMLYLKHPAWLWIKKHAKHLIPPIDEALQAKFDDGNAFEHYVESLYPNLVRVGFDDYNEYLDMPHKTNMAWKNGAENVAQGRYETGSITCISDIVRKEGDSFILTEIKSSTSAKEEHIWDLAFQKIVLEGAGYPIKKCEVAHVNNRYVRSGDIIASDISQFTDVTEKVHELIEGTKLRIEKAITIAALDKMPDPNPERARLGSYVDWLDIRQKISPPLPDNSIYFLPYMDAEKSTKLIKEGITTVDEITDVTVLKRSTQKYLAARAEGRRVVETEKLDEFLSQISFPVYYLDYEASQSLLPPWDGTRPYQHVPFQYSLHIVKSLDGEAEHREYLHQDASNPMPNFIESLKKNIGNEGSILVWYQAYEKTRNKELGEMYPDSATFLQDLNDRTIDLMKPFASDMVRDEAFKGSASIKNVLPVLIPNFSYESLDIQEGATAARKWKEVTLGKEIPQTERDRVYSELLEYCKLDTLAMVKIHKALADFCA